MIRACSCFFPGIPLIFSLLICVPCRGEDAVTRQQISSTLYRQIQEIVIPESRSADFQPARVWVPSMAADADRKLPLVVLLHTWSGNYLQDRFSGGERDGILEVVEGCFLRDWAMVMPDFRGPNVRPEACASPEAIQDVLDSVHFMRSLYPIDGRAVFLVGVSGGGHMALMMAAKAPELFSGVSAWVPISDLGTWHRQCREMGLRYADHLELVCGGSPGSSEEVDRQYKMRSPLFLLRNPSLSGLPIEINAGIRDGHEGSVPVSHSLLAFNALAEANQLPENRIPGDLIRRLAAEPIVPLEHRYEASPEEGSHRRHTVLFRRRAGAALVTLFDGGHEGDIPAAFQFLDAVLTGQSRKIPVTEGE